MNHNVSAGMGVGLKVKRAWELELLLFLIKNSITTVRFLYLYVPSLNKKINQQLGRVYIPFLRLAPQLSDTMWVIVKDWLFVKCSMENSMLFFSFTVPFIFLHILLKFWLVHIYAICPGTLGARKAIGFYK